MNSAYKIYDKYNFYPTYYASLDDTVIISHKKQLQKLLDTKKIQKYFYYKWSHYKPLCKRTDYIFKENENYVGVVKTGIYSGISSNFKDFKSWGNTGSDCVQIAIMMGYRNIYIIGVDGYIEKIKSAQLVNCNNMQKLLMKETPKNNENYFFNDYQEKGEIYNIPNAMKWHIPGWVYATSTCNKNNIKIFNMSNKEYIKTIPFIDYDEFVKNIELL